MKQSLYEITADVMAMEDLIEDAIVDKDGNPRELGETEKAALNALVEEMQGSFEGKAERICQFIQNQKAFAEMCDDEEKRLYARRKTAERKVSSLKWLLEENMKRAGMKKITAGTFQLTIQNNPPSVYVKNETEIPDYFFKVIPEQRQLDKRFLLESLKTGDVPGAMLSQSTSIRIR